MHHAPNVSDPYHRNGLLTPTTYHSHPLSNNNNNNNINKQSSNSSFNNNNNNLIGGGIGGVGTNGAGTTGYHHSNQQNLDNAAAVNANGVELDSRGRPKTKRNFFGNIKKR